MAQVGYFISIHAARVGCDQLDKLDHAELDISIHAARVGCDICRLVVYIGTIDFNPRSPSGLRQNRMHAYRNGRAFQSTQPEWAATAWIVRQFVLLTFQSTQPEWAATQLRDRILNREQISIHAARVGCDKTL